MTTSPTDSRCPRCGAALPPNTPLGACPACLLAVAAGPASELTEGLTGAADALSSGAYASEPARFAPGDTLGAYRIVALLGRGGMGEVYEAVAEDGRRVALKLLRERLTSDVDRQRFLREGVLAASVTHRNCVYVYGSEEIDGLPMIAMELAPGGTLKQAVEQFGPRTVTQAVREILQVVDGLEAAASAGILHRDVKPSNCFIDANGDIKVGDFGLSMSLNPSDGELAWRPAFQGTPEFAAPEQLRGEPLDLRADIYSVGATLFFLLTGYSPFGERNIKKLIELKTTRSAPAADAHLPDIPAGLAALAGACMSPDRDRRPQTYADLRARLLPFASPLPEPASLIRRFGAMMLDGWMAGLATPLLMAIRSTSSWNADRAVAALLSVVLYAVFERALGGTPGKLVLGIRVTNAEGRNPGLGQAAMRWLISLGPIAITSALQAAGLLDSFKIGQLFIGSILPLAILIFPLCSALFARFRHDNAMFHDLWTGTRVVRSKPQPVAAADRASDREPTPALVTRPMEVESIGPFDVIGKIGESGSGDLLLGRDARLNRLVWIHRRPNVPGALPAARRLLALPTRPRWLAGGDTWDAFEVPDGRAFHSADRGSADWTRVSAWLVDLARDFEAADVVAALPTLQLDHLWLTANGRMMLLDFPAPGAARDVAPADQSAPQFLARFADAAGGSQSKPRSIAVVTAALGDGWMTTRAAAAILQKLSHQPIQLSRWHRALPILVCALPAIVFAAGTWLQHASDRSRYEGPDAALLAVLDKMSPVDELPGSLETRTMLRAFVAESFRKEVSAGPSFWDSPRGREFSRYRAAIEHAVKWTSPASPEYARAAREAAETLLHTERARRVDVSDFYPGIVARWMLMLLVPTALLSFVNSFISTPFLFRLTRQALEDQEGLDASLVRRVIRSASTWWPLLLIPVNPWLPIVFLAAGALYAIVDPERSIQDRLAGTFVAPR